MRGFAYVVACIAAIGIMIGIGLMPVQQDTATSSSTISPVNDSESPSVFASSGSLTLDVPDMHCEFACFPRVKESIEGNDGVQSVELAEQQEEGVLDNRQVIVHYEAGFDLAKALTLLEKEGYESTPVQ